MRCRQPLLLSVGLVAGSAALSSATSCASPQTSRAAAVDPFAAEARAQLPFNRLRAQAAAAAVGRTPATALLAPRAVRRGAPVEFASGDTTLTAFVVAPVRMPAHPAAPGERLPALLYIPGDSAAETVEATVAAVVDAGLVVMVAPAPRAAEGAFAAAVAVEDLLAATRALADQPDVDASRLAVYGEGSGGPFAALLAVVADVPFTTFVAARVDVDATPLFLPHVEELVHPLLLLVPQNESARARRAQARAAAAERTIDVRVVEDAGAARRALVALLAAPATVALR